MCGVFYLDANSKTDTKAEAEFVRIGNTTVEINNYYDGEISLLELIKNALRRDAEAVLRNQDNA